MRPVVVCPDISSPAQSLASVIKVPSKSCFPCLAAFCSFCLGSLGPYSASLRQHKNAKARHISTISSPARKVHMLDSRKHQYFRTDRHESVSVTLEAIDSDGGSLAASSLVMPQRAPSLVEASTPTQTLARVERYEIKLTELAAFE